jgi:hypothetical protein
VYSLRRFLLFATAASFLLAGTASAGSITQVQWSVTGGGFSSTSLANGPALGGTLTFTPFAGTITTNLLAPHAGSFAFNAFGNPGNTLFLSPWSASLSISPSFSAFISTFSWAGQAFSGGNLAPFGMVATVAPVFRHLLISQTVGNLTVTHVSGIFGVARHTLALGNEVRTAAVPEPTTGALLGLGLLVGLAGTAARTRRSN